MVRSEAAAPGHEPAHDRGSTRSHCPWRVVRSRHGCIPVRALAHTRSLERRTGETGRCSAPHTHAANGPSVDRTRGRVAADRVGRGGFPGRRASRRKTSARRRRRGRSQRRQSGTHHRREPTGREGNWRCGVRWIHQWRRRARDRHHETCERYDAGQDHSDGP